MRILLNASTIHIGGGIQAATALVSESLKWPSHEWAYALSPEVGSQLGEGFHGRQVEVIDLQPRSVAKVVRARNQLDALEQSFRPDICFTLFGPPYWSPSVAHLCGFADPWVIFGRNDGWPLLPSRSRLKTVLLSAIKRFALRREWHYLLETRTACREFADRLGVDANRVHWVPNAPHPCFDEWLERNAARSARARKGPFAVLCLSAYYPHKNLESIPRIAAAIARYGMRDLEFRLTLPPESPAWRRIEREAARLCSTGPRVRNLGPQHISSCPELYAEASCVLLPSVLEVFSATYVEAIVMGKPLVTPDIPAAREVAEGAALLYPPMDDMAAAEIIRRLVVDNEFYEAATRRSLAHRRLIVRSAERFKKTVDILESIAAGKESARSSGGFIIGR